MSSAESDGATSRVCGFEKISCCQVSVSLSEKEITPGSTSRARCEADSRAGVDIAVKADTGVRYPTQLQPRS